MIERTGHYARSNSSYYGRCNSIFKTLFNFGPFESISPQFITRYYARILLKKDELLCLPAQ